MNEPSTVRVHDNFQGRRILFDMTEADALEIFSGCSAGENPVSFLKRCQKERRELAAMYKNAKVSGVLFLVVLFFLRRFIP